MLGRSRFDISTGGGATGAGAQVLARQIILAGVTPGGVVNRLYRPSSIAGVRGVSSYGPLAEAACYLFDGEGAPPAPMLLPIEPSQLGDASAVTHVGPGTGTVAVSFAPHFPFVVKITTAGTIGTMKFRVSYDGGLTWSDAVTSADSGGGDFTYGDAEDNYMTDKLEHVMFQGEGRTAGNDQNALEIELALFILHVHPHGGDFVVYPA